MNSNALKINVIMKLEPFRRGIKMWNKSYVKSKLLIVVNFIVSIRPKSSPKSRTGYL